MMNTASLSKMKKEELVELCKQHSITGYSKLKKDELVAVLAEALSEGTEEEAAPSALAPEQAVPAPAAKEAPAAQDGLTRYCTALVNLWGIAPAAMIAAAYNRHNDAAVTSDDVIAAAPCPVQEGMLLHEKLAGDEKALRELRKKQEGFSYYVPSPTHIADYLEDNYHERTHEFAAMRDYMVRTFGISEGIALANTIKLLQNLGDGNDLNHLMMDLANSGVRFETEEQFRNFSVLFGKLRATARFWAFCGHTAAEALNFTKSGPVRVLKVGRNDPCPCGSGKKYKKCCGR